MDFKALPKPQMQHCHCTLLSHRSKCVPFHSQRASKPFRQRRVLAKAEEDGFQDKIKKLKASQKKQEKQDKKDGKKDGKENPQAGTKTQQKQNYDFSGEQLHFESPPHRGDLATNIALGATLLWLPLTIAAITRAAFVKYRFTDKRISVITEAPWKKERLDAAYQEVSDVQTVGRGIGLWGDMVVTLRNSNKIEMRSLPKFLELKEYINQRKEAMGPVTENVESTDVDKIKSPKGFGKS